MIVLTTPMLVGALLAFCFLTIMWWAARAITERDQSARARIDCLRSEVLSLRGDITEMRDELTELRASLHDRHPASAFRTPPAAAQLPPPASEDWTGEWPSDVVLIEDTRPATSSSAAVDSADPKASKAAAPSGRTP